MAGHVESGVHARGSSEAAVAAAAKSTARLPDLVAEACSRFDVDPARLATPVRDRLVTKVRAWIAHQARERGIASLAAVARELRRDESTLREAMRLHKKDLD